MQTSLVVAGALAGSMLMTAGASRASTAAEDLVPRSFGRTAPGLRAEARARHA